MCCRAPASAAFQSSASTRRRLPPKSIASAIVICWRRWWDATSSAISTVTISITSPKRAARGSGKARWRSSRASIPRSRPLSPSQRPSARWRRASTSWRRPAGALKDEFDSVATQWFIVSDLGLTAFSGNDGIHAFVHSLDTTQAKGAVEVRLLSRSNEVLSRKRTADSGHVHFEADLAGGEGALAPAMLIASDGDGDYAFLSLKAPPFDLTDRGVAGRAVPSGLDAFVYTERGVYRSGETVQVTTLLRDGQGMAVVNVPLTLVVERPDGVEYRRAVVPDQGLGGRALSVGLVSSAPSGTWRVRRSEAPAARRGDLHGRGLRARPDRIRAEFEGERDIDDERGRDQRGRALSLWSAGRQTRARRRGHRFAGERAPRLCPLSVRARRRGCGDHSPAVGKPA